MATHSPSTAPAAAGHGSVSCTPDLCTYTPDPGFFGTDSFTYTIHDGFGGIDEGAVTVTVGSIGDRCEPHSCNRHDRPRCNLDQPRRHPVPAHARARRGCVERTVLRRSPFSRRSPFPRRSPFARRSPVSEFAPFARRSPLASATPLSEIPSTFRAGRPALLANTPLAGTPTQSITFGQFLDLYTPPGPPTQALRDLTIVDVSYFDGTPIADASPAAFLLGATPVAELRYEAQTWCDRLAADTLGATTCAPLNVGPDHHAYRARRRPRSRQGSVGTPRSPAA